VVSGFRAFDLWFYELGVLVEVDGEQHSCSGFGSTDVTTQEWRDRVKEEAAVQDGYHVVRLHFSNVREWMGVMGVALEAAAAGKPACVHYTSAYPPRAVHPSS
jgi:very-short-patch-repair endonuclease